jgi:hypothetical protein
MLALICSACRVPASVTTGTPASSAASVVSPPVYGSVSSPRRERERLGERGGGLVRAAAGGECYTEVVLQCRVAGPAQVRADTRQPLHRIERWRSARLPRRSPAATRSSRGAGGSVSAECANER